MRHISLLIIALHLILGIVLAASCTRHRIDPDIEASLDALDRAIADRPQVMEARIAKADSLKQVYHRAGTPRERFDALDEVISEYRPFNTDSTLRYVRLRQQAAYELGDSDCILNAEMNMADYMGFTGSYIEALDILEPIDGHHLPDYLRPYLYHLKRTIYGRLYDLSSRPEEREKYFTLTDTYRDSIMSVADVNSLAYQITRSDQLNAHGRPDEAIQSFSDFVREANLSDAQTAVAAYTLSTSYGLMGDENNQMRQLLISSIADMHSGVKEYLALRDLALLLYKQGDIERAYRYMKLCMEDAEECNAQQRIIEISRSLPIINDMYFEMVDRQHHRMIVYMIIVCFMAVILIVLLWFAVRQMKRAQDAHRTVAQMNARLTELNGELKDYNSRLSEANAVITENSQLKEEYIARYMTQCLMYIDNIDRYRKTINKLAMSGKIDELKRQTKSVDFVDGELKSFYSDFDQTFLKLFPTFVADFNRLLKPDEQIVPKSPDSLNVELRIFALIRLGITDSVTIAKFLRYSVTTIYNYRTRVRNRAIGDRDTLEQRMMSIGRAKM